MLYMYWTPLGEVTKESLESRGKFAVNKKRLIILFIIGTR